MKLIENGILLFGKYEGRDISDIYRKDRKYLEWCYENLEDEELLTAIENEYN